MIYFVRHGQTDWNIVRKLQGRADIPLNEKGIEQAHQLAKQIENIHFDKVFCSPLQRARQTCEIIFKGEVTFDERIIERDFGEFEGLKMDEFDHDAFWNSHKNQVFEKAEGLPHLIERVYDFMREITTKYTGKNVLLVCHGGIGLIIKSYFDGEPQDGNYIQFLMDNGSYVTFPC